MTPEQDAHLLLKQMKRYEPDWNAVLHTLRTNPRVVIPLQHDGSNPVHVACTNNAPLSVVQLLVQQLPDHLKKQNSDGKLPLHMACTFRQSLEVIQFLVQQHPSAVKEKCNDGMLPLHLACHLNAQSLEVIQFLVQQHPKAVKETGKFGEFPLHMACAHIQSLKEIQWLTQQYPDAVKKTNSSGHFPLHLACAHKQSLKVIRWLAQQHPNAVKEKSIGGNLPLHLACGEEQSLEVIQWLVRQHPNAVKEKNDSCQFPLHLACESNQSLNVIRWLIQKHPHAVKERQKDGDLPLHLCLHSRDKSIEVLDLLVQKYPNAVTERNRFGFLPLHSACIYKFSLKGIQWLAQQHPDAIKQKNNGDLPLHLACGSKQSLEVIEWLVQQHPNAIIKRNSDGQLPLHLACAHSRSLEVIQLLAQQHPDSVEDKNSYGELPLHLACANKQSLEVIQFLAQYHPDTVKDKNSYGQLPLHLACAKTQSLEVIIWLIQQHPNHISETTQDGLTPCDLAKQPFDGQSPDAETVHWLEAFESNQIGLAKGLPPAPLNFSPCSGKEETLGFSPPPTFADIDRAKPSMPCTFNQSLEVTDLLAQHHPNSVKDKNGDGQLPLHLACANNQSFEVIQLLAQLYPDSVKDKNSDGQLPLHLACAKKQSLEVIQLLAQHHPDSVKVKNSDGQLPLHLACANKQSLDVVSWLIQQHPDSVKDNDKFRHLPVHLACAHKQSLEVIQLLVQQRPDHISKTTCDGLTPGDLAKHPADGQSPDAETVHWLKTFESGHTDLANGSPSTLSPGAKITPSLSPPHAVMDIDLANPSTAAADDVNSRDRSSFDASREKKNEMAAVSSFFTLESFLNEEMIGNGSFGTVYKGNDSDLHCSFTVKTKNPDFPWDGHSVNVQKANEAFLTEVKALSLLRHPIIEALYAGASLGDVRCCSYFVTELVGKGSLESFWKADLGPERLSPLRRRIQIALDVMTAIQFLHVGNDEFSGCCHCDIKSANILLKRDFTAQLINCGLAKSVIDSQLTTGGLNESAPEHVCGGMQFERSCDIYSFGVVLAELLTGKGQHQMNECVASFRVEKQHIEGSNDVTRDIKKELDPALGYDTFELPKFVLNFVDLAICCMQQNPDDRPLGKAVMEKLVAISSQCGVLRSNADHLISVGDLLPCKLEKSMDKCKFCRTFPSASPHSICAVCKSAQQRRAQMPFGRESRTHFGADATVDASSSLLGDLNGIRLNNPVPRLFILMPIAIKSALTHPRAWFRSQYRTRYHLYFVCSHSMKAIEPPLSVIVTTCWVEKVAPVLAMSLVLLHRGLKPGVTVDLGSRESGVTLRINNTRIAEMLDAVGDILVETGSFDFLVRLRGNLVLDVEDINLLNGDAYELIVETAGGDMGWKDSMVPFRWNGSAQIFWVDKDSTTNNDAMDEHNNSDSLAHRDTGDAQDIQGSGEPDSDEDSVS